MSLRNLTYVAAAAALVLASTTVSASAADALSSADVHRTPPPPAGETAGAVAMWRASYVDEAGAVPVGASEKGVEYGVSGSFSIGPAGTVKGWMRWEQFSPTTVGDDVTRSFTQLLEVDCQAGRGRMLALDLYPYNNLQGEARHVDAQDPQWSYARPGTVLEHNIALMCSTAKSALASVIAQASAAAPLGAGSSNSALASLPVQK